MSTGHFRCAYIDSSGRQCEIWYPVPSDESEFCPLHRGILHSNNRIATPTDEYVRVRAEIEQSCYELTANLTDAERVNYYDEHIAAIEKIIEAEKLKVNTMRALRAGSIEKLSAEEISRRRAIKVSAAIVKEKKVSVKKDPYAYLIKAIMAANPTLTEDQARERAMQ